MKLRHHVSGAIERGEAEAIVGKPMMTEAEARAHAKKMGRGYVAKKRGNVHSHEWGVWCKASAHFCEF